MIEFELKFFLTTRSKVSMSVKVLFSKKIIIYSKSYKGYSENPDNT